MQALRKHSSGTLWVGLVMEAPEDDRRGQETPVSGLHLTVIGLPVDATPSLTPSHASLLAPLSSRGCT